MLRLPLQSPPLSRRPRPTRHLPTAALADALREQASGVDAAFARRIRVVSSGWDCLMRVWAVDVGSDGTGTGFKATPEKVFGRPGDGGHTREVQALAAVGPDTLASASRDCLIKVWSVSTGACQFELAGHSNWVTCLDVDRKAEVLLSGSDDGTLRLWSLADRRCVFSEYGHKGDVTAVRCVRAEVEKAMGGAAAGQGGAVVYAVTASADKTICCWEIRKQEAGQKAAGAQRGWHLPAFVAAACMLTK